MITKIKRELRKKLIKQSIKGPGELINIVEIELYLKSLFKWINLHY